MSQVQLFKAPTQVLTVPEGINLQALLYEVKHVFFVSLGPHTMTSMYESIADVNEMVGNNLLPRVPRPSLADQLAVLSKQVPIIISEILETFTAAHNWWLGDGDISDEMITEELINGYADIIYTVGGYSARLGDGIIQRLGIYGVCMDCLGSYRDTVMEGVCGEQISKFIKEDDIPEAQALFDKKGIEVDIVPGTGDWYVIKSARDQIVDGEHYPQGKWLKGPNFVRYSLPDEIKRHFIDNGQISNSVYKVVEYLTQDAVGTKGTTHVHTLTHTLDVLNDIIVSNFGESWKMNMAKRDKFISILQELKDI